MNIKKLKIYNYRCFGEKEHEIELDKLSAFIGNNSAGKSAALLALNTIFSENSKDRILKRSDFFLGKNEDPESIMERNLYIEVLLGFEQDLKDDQSSAVAKMFNQFVVNDEF